MEQPSWMNPDEDDSPGVHVKTIMPKSNMNINYKRYDRKKTEARCLLSEEEEDESTKCCCCIDIILCYFRTFHTFTAIIGFANLASNFLLLISYSVAQVRDIVIQTYAIIFCIIIICVEADLRIVVDHLKLMDNWLIRGVFYIL